MLVAISSMEALVVSKYGIPTRLNSCSARRTSYSHCSSEAYRVLDLRWVRIWCSRPGAMVRPKTLSW